MIASMIFVVTDMCNLVLSCTIPFVIHCVMSFTLFNPQIIFSEFLLLDRPAFHQYGLYSSYHETWLNHPLLWS